MSLRSPPGGVATVSTEAWELQSVEAWSRAFASSAQRSKDPQRWYASNVWANSIKSSTSASADGIWLNCSLAVVMVLGFIQCCLT